MMQYKYIVVSIHELDISPRSRACRRTFRGDMSNLCVETAIHNKYYTLIQRNNTHLNNVIIQQSFSCNITYCTLFLTTMVCFCLSGLDAE